VIVAAFDGTDGACNALAYAGGLAERAGAQLVVIFVDSCVRLDVPRPDNDSWIHEAVSAVLGRPRYSVEVVASLGDPASVIRSCAVSRQADIVVVGQPRHPRRHVLGSVPGQLTRRPACPVVVVPGT
jgi:nucleotide-binding universal stress UspA family protein